MSPENDVTQMIFKYTVNMTISLHLFLRLRHVSYSFIFGTTFTKTIYIVIVYTAFIGKRIVRL